MKDSIKKNKDLFQNMDNAYKMQLNILAKVYASISKRSILPESLTSWSRYHLTKYKGFIFPIPEFSKNNKLQDLIENLSKKYWNYKGYYNLESKSNKIVKHFCICELIMFRF